MADAALIQAVPAATANGTPLPNAPPNPIGAQLYFVGAGSVTYAIASAQPSAAPSPVFTASQATVGAFVFKETLLPGQNLYVTALSGSVLFRWIMGG